MFEYSLQNKNKTFVFGIKSDVDYLHLTNQPSAVEYLPKNSKYVCVPLCFHKNIPS